MKRELCAAAAVVLLSSAPALAQTAPPTVPPSITNAVESILTKLGGDAAAPYGLDPNHSRGSVTYFKRFDLQLRMPLNTYRDVRLHQGTVINPRGATIEPGQVLDVIGHANSDGSLNADTITIVH
jgi:opacity protein-like surface antigen